ncbi:MULTISPECIES: hypothetical protein [Brucella]|uniref:Lipoprotein n=15 Tax=Brucella TaxID=234 RepID=Q2YR70_BRUA2|nr:MULTISPECIES: hypothetical protein [Brucella]EPZ75944.1 hypothetical protein M798_08655 [Brucella melitensis ADMAS-G1]ERM86964.1 hypothetical protein P865_04610 [Brucella abortus 82]ERT84089.1 hypothetical protein P050_01903 [Brucella abortus 90-12178]ERU05825.1 hypothetical protein P039_01527 [Brucella abortus 07-0994-2411]ERU10512.1 hypothetical protein P038_00127 [Brucella abortus 99-9971-135]EXU82590.1 hypothetical protein AX23_12360 [Brucella melitensis 548]KEX96204.1 hypothetical pr
MTIDLKAGTKRLIWRTAMAVPFVAALSGCTATAWTEKVSINTAPLPKECAGWEKIDLKQRTTMVLLREDPKLVVNIDAHNLKGRNLGCWQ